MSTDLRRVVRDGLWDQNVVLSQMLALCPAMAVTTSGTNGLGMGLAFTAMQLVTMEHSPPETLGRATSTLQLVHTGAIALAAGIGGAIIAKVTPLSQALLAQDALAIVALVLGFTCAGRLHAPRRSGGR